ncbi:MAG TPA: NHL repeat-containing protein [Chloroflexia bacterium]|nr:NHL repeat-containing protein [Chloroflexia bacterium]
MRAKKRNHLLYDFRIIAIMLLILALLPSDWKAAQAKDNSQYFPETGKTVSGKFLEYWQRNGGLATYGFPITEAQNEVDPETGKTFLIQWFERNRFELHPEYAGTPFEVSLGLLGKDLRRDALVGDPDFIRAKPLPVFKGNNPAPVFFSETGHNLGGDFLEYWQRNGGLTRFGYPISEAHYELDQETGRAFMVQWFERARFEFHRENKPPHNILLGLLGKQIKSDKSNHLEFIRKISWTSPLFAGGSSFTLDSYGNIYAFLQPEIYKFDNYGRLLFKWYPSQSGAISIYDPLLTTDNQNNVYLVDSSNNQLRKFDSGGHFLEKWTILTDARQVTKPFSAVTVDQHGNIFIADQSLNYVYKFDNKGQLLLTLGISQRGDGQFLEPVGLGTDLQDNLFVLDRAKRIQKFDNAGHFLLKWGLEEPIGVSSSLIKLVVDAFGTVYVSDNIKNSLYKYDNQGNLLARFDGSGSKPELSNNFFLIGSDPAGNIYTAGGLDIHKFSPAGELLSEIGSFDNSLQSFSAPAGITCDQQNNFYVVNSFTGKLLKYDNQGRLLLTFGERGPKWTLPLDVAVDSQGNIFVADAERNYIHKFDSQGHFLLGWGKVNKNAQGFDIYQFEGIKNLRVDSKGNVYVLDHKGVHKFDNQGNFLLEWYRFNDNTRQLLDPYSMTLDQNDNIYILEADDIYLPGRKMLGNILKFDSEGHFLLSWGEKGTEPGQFVKPIALTSDYKGHLYVIDGDNGQINKYDGEGHFIFRWQNTGIADGQLYAQPGNPMWTAIFYLAVDHAGTLYVSEFYENRVQVYQQP